MDIEGFFREYPETAVAFSGGTDSSYLLYTASKYAARTKGYYVKTAFQPSFELDDAVRFAAMYNIDLKVIETDIFEDSAILSNLPERCYLCKKKIMGEILRSAADDGFTVLADGTNASDDSSDRPGMKALEEMKILSPLRMCGLGKQEIRRLSHEAGLFTAFKPAYACLATRIRTGIPITRENLERTEWAENFLFELGFTDFRVRTEQNNTARLEIRKDQTELFEQFRSEITGRLSEKYDSVMPEIGLRDF